MNVLKDEIRFFLTIGVEIMNTKNLETLMAIIETGSFQKAATRLDYTPSAVTSQIKQLENELSIKLFEKIGRKMELTQAGKDVLPFIKEILHNVEKLNNYKKDISEITGTLRLVAPDSIFIYNMQPIIKAILHTAPNIRLIVNSLPSHEINQAIVDGSADIGIDCDKGNFPASLVHKSLRSVAACLIASPFIDPKETDFITPHQRKRFAIIGNEPKANYQTALDEYLDSKDIVLRPFMKFQSIEAVKRSVMNDLGIAYVPKFSVEDELRNGSLIQLKTELDGKLYPSVCVYHKNKWLSSQMKMAIQIIEEHTKVDLV